MRISVNLASKPFVELRPLYAQLRLAMAALAVVAVGVGVALHVETARANTAQAQMDALKAQTARYENQLSANEARMRQPQNRAVLDRAQFLNRTFAQKSFSWTAVMMDLEHVLPAGVQVTSIEPLMSKEGDVSIRMRVSGDRDRAVELVRNLEASQRFLKPTLTSESLETTQATGRGPAPGEGVPGGVEFDILSSYNPLPMRQTKPVDDAKKAEAAGSAADTTAKGATKPAAKAKAAGPRRAQSKHVLAGGAR
jgi:type IV pilus assembly protein PilN